MAHGCLSSGLRDAAVDRGAPRALQRVDEPAGKARDDGDTETYKSRQRHRELRRNTDAAEEQDVEGFAHAETVDAHRHHASQ